MMRNRFALPASAAAAFLIAAVVMQGTNFPAKPPANVPWRCVGGCGTSAGGAGNTGASVRWIGQGIPGTLIDIEFQNAAASMSSPRDSLMPQKNIFVLLQSLYLHLRPIDVQISLPLEYKYAVIAKKIDQTEISMHGMGDLTADISWKFGNEGQIVPRIGLSFPTGTSDFFNRFELLPSDMQLGTGRFGGWIGLDYMISKDWGIICISPG
jgi:hypothetical protein